MFLAAIEVDKIQDVIFQADKLKEMLGASRLIEETTGHVKDILEKHPDVELYWPVSGVFKLRSGDLSKLAPCLREITMYFGRELGLSASSHIEEQSTGRSFSQCWQELESGMRQAKDSKVGEDGSPGLPFFAPCRVIPGRSANYWRPGLQADEQNRRRALISDEASVRKPDEKGLPIIDFDIESSGYRQPHDLDDLVAQDAADSYIAFVKADGDGLGKFLAGLEWESIKWEDASEEPHLKACAFATRLSVVFKSSLREAIAKVVEPSKSSGDIFPIAPLLQGGEDLWLLCRRDLALRLVRNFGEVFACNVKDDPVLSGALSSSGSNDPITLSFSVLFAQKGYPFDSQADLVNELIKIAKAYRKTLPVDKKEGCVDFHWMEATGRSTIRQIRESGYAYVDDNKTFYLFSKPWTISELGSMLDAAEELRDVSRRKLHQLDEILRRGQYMSAAAAHQWWHALEKREQMQWSKAMGLIPLRMRPHPLAIDPSGASPLDPGFWKTEENKPNERLSSILDLLEILEIGTAPDNK